MNLLLKFISAVMLWGIVVYMIIYVDPATVKDVGIEGAYLPLLIPFFASCWYTAFIIFAAFWSPLAIALLLILSLVLGIAGLMNIFLGLVITAMIGFVIFLQVKH